LVSKRPIWLADAAQSEAAFPLKSHKPLKQHDQSDLVVPKFGQPVGSQPSLQFLVRFDFHRIDPQYWPSGQVKLQIIGRIDPLTFK